MNISKPLAFFFMMFLIGTGCKSTQKIRTGASDINHPQSEPASEESVAEAANLYKEWNTIPFETLAAKIKIEYTEGSISQPEVNAFLRMQKDSVIWISVTASFLNIEGLRILVTPDSVIILNRLEKTIESHSVDFVKELTSVPFSFDDVQKLIAGRLVLNEGTTLDVNKAGKYLQTILKSPHATNTAYFKMPEGLLAKQTLNIREPGNYVTADLLYDDYLKKERPPFSIKRNVTIPEREIDIVLTFKQVEFNNELSFPFSRPSGYTVK